MYIQSLERDYKYYYYIIRVGLHMKKRICSFMLCIILFITIVPINTGRVEAKETLQITGDRISVSGFEGHTLAVQQDGTLWAWGRNLEGQLGIGTNTYKEGTPQKVMEQVSCVYADNKENSFAIKTDRSLWAWGRNVYGNLGQYDTFSNKPVKIAEEVVQISGGIFLKSDGSAWRFGKNDVFEDIALKPVKIAENVSYVNGGHELFIIKNDGSLWICGPNYLNLTGRNTGSFSEFVPVADNVKSVTQGVYSAFIIKNDDTLWGCGSNMGHKLSLEDSESKNFEEFIKLEDNVEKVIDANSHLLIFKKDGSMYMKGRNDTYGPILGTGESSFSDLTLLKENVADIAGNSGTRYYIDKNGNLFGWGYNTYGQIDNTWTDTLNPTFIKNGFNDLSEQEEIQITEGSIKIKVNEETIILATLYKDKFITDNQTGVTWSSSDPSVAAIIKNTDGFLSVVVKGISNGEAIITAHSNNGKTDSCKVIVGTGKKNGDFEEYFYKKGDNYYYNGKQISNGYFIIPGNLIIDTPMKLSGSCRITANKITVFKNLTLSPKSQIVSNSNFELKKKAVLEFVKGGTITCKKNFNVKEKASIKGFSAKSTIQVENNFSYNSTENTSITDGNIEVYGNVTLKKNFNLLKNGVLKVKGDSRHTITGDKSCTLATLDLSECTLKNLKLRGECAVGAIKTVAIPTTSDSRVLDYFTFSAVGVKQDAILDKMIAGVLYSIVSDKSAKKDLLKHLFSNGNFEGLAMYTGSTFDIPVLVNYNNKYESGTVSGSLNGFGELAFGSVIYTSNNRRYEVVFSPSSSISDKTLTQFMNGLSQEAQKEITSQAEECFTSIVLSALETISKEVKLKKGILFCNLINQEEKLDDLGDIMTILMDY